MQGRHRVTEASLGHEHGAGREEAMVSVPNPVIIQRHHEKIRLGQASPEWTARPNPHAALSHHGVAQRSTQPVKNGRLHEKDWIAAAADPAPPQQDSPGCTDGCRTSRVMTASGSPWCCSDRAAICSPVTHPSVRRSKRVTGRSERLSPMASLKKRQPRRQ